MCEKRDGIGFGFLNVRAERQAPDQILSLKWSMALSIPSRKKNCAILYGNPPSRRLQGLSPELPHSRRSICHATDRRNEVMHDVPFVAITGEEWKLQCFCRPLRCAMILPLGIVLLVAGFACKSSRPAKLHSEAIDEKYLPQSTNHPGRSCAKRHHS